MSSAISWLLSNPKGFGNDARNPVQRERRKTLQYYLLTLYRGKIYKHSIFARTQEFPIQLPAFKDRFRNHLTLEIYLNIC